MDFAYVYAGITYKFLEEAFKIIENTKGEKKIKFLYSTVDEYVSSIRIQQTQKGFSWPVFNGDFFPYRGNYNLHYWTGFYSSRPNLKRKIKEFTGLTKASVTLYSLESLITGFNTT